MRKMKIFLLLALSLLFLSLFFISGCANGISSSNNKVIFDNNMGSPEAYFCLEDNCEFQLIKLINSSSSADCAFYDLDLEMLISVLKQKNARLVVDGDNKEYLDGYGNFRFDSGKGLMHNKFCIINNSVVWTGSFNPTTNGNTKNDNNVVVIDSLFVAENFNDEFEELWKGEFGKGGMVDNKQIFYSNGSVVNLFCPEDNCKENVLEVLNSANKSIYFITFSFTDKDIAEALVQQSLNGLDVQGIMEKRRINMKYNMYKYLVSNNVDVKGDNNTWFLHHKVFIVDEKIVITGSYNPTSSGNTINDENIVIIEDRSVAEKFLREFNKLFF